MLESFFGFTGLPFGRNVDAACLMRTEAWDEMDERLRHVARTVGLGCLLETRGQERPRPSVASPKILMPGSTECSTCATPF